MLDKQLKEIIMDIGFTIDYPEEVRAIEASLINKGKFCEDCGVQLDDMVNCNNEFSNEYCDNCWGKFIKEYFPNSN